MNNNNPNNLQNEILRMLKMSNFGSKKTNIAESTSGNRLMKEDFMSDLDDIFGGPAEDGADDGLSTNGNKEVLSFQLKAAMICHSLSEYQAIMLDLMSDYSPNTKGAKAKDDPTTFVDKKPVQKIKGIGSDYYHVMKFGNTDATKHTPHANYDKEWDKILKTRRVPITFINGEMQTREMTSQEKKFFAKWYNDKGTVSMISSGGGKLTDMGKAQLEFLARVITGKPADEKESTLFNILGDHGNHYKSVAKYIIFLFYSKALIPFIKRLTHRAHASVNDLQLSEFIEHGVLHAIDQLPKFYDPSRGNLGSFIIQTVKNSVKNQIAEISDYKLDLTQAAEYLFQQKPPFYILSIADPNDPNIRKTNFVSATLYKPEGVLANGKKSKAIYRYMYNDANAVIADLTNDARSGRLKAGATGKEEENKRSPLAKEYLTLQGKQLFYKSFAPNPGEVADNLGLQNIDPYESNMFKVDVLPVQAKQAINQVFDEIIQLFIVGKRSAEHPASKAVQNYARFIKENTDLIKDLMFDVLNYGAMTEVYTKAWRLENSNTVVPAGRPVETETGQDGRKHYKKDYKGRIPGPGDTTFVWSTGAEAEAEIKKQFESMFIAKAMEKYGSKMQNNNITVAKELQVIAHDLCNKVLLGIRKFFGHITKDNYLPNQNIDKFNILMKNYSAAMMADSMLAEMRLQMKKLLK